ncbi:hypothetical protein HPB51_008350 [Rhipicephalus microplus]|uniref:Uncharacterized protein n=1 Tax=Rhipicephalus microplus TaxID=6941 RepID=A0A9J6ESM8_RHIMP|nr:hypothetical protein HPB51_008350 [Rhipicephalus microplus]
MASTILAYTENAAAAARIRSCSLLVSIGFTMPVDQDVLHRIMNDKMRVGTEELDCEELSRRISGLGLNVPCSVRGGLLKDGRSVATSTCHIFDDQSRWNYVLWHVGLQLRELIVPGRLSLVRVVYRGRGGWKQRERSRDARILFHVLLVQHSCVKSIHVDDALVEGSGLGECRERVVSALEKNTSSMVAHTWQSVR